MLQHVRLELARCHDFPEGSPDRGYEMILPLTADGHLDAEGWLQHRDETRFRRFWDGMEDTGVIAHGHNRWRLTFQDRQNEEEVIFRGDHHRFAVGEYISINEPDGLMRTFRVARLG